MPDLRTWLNEVDKLGQLTTVDNVDWDLELSTLTEIINECSKTRPAILFDQIRDYPQGYGSRRILFPQRSAWRSTLGMKAGLSDIELIQAWRRQVKKSLRLLPKPFPPPRFSRTCREVKTSTCSSFRCRAAELDGGRYIGTDDLVITRDPEEDWVNVGTYRIMVRPDCLALHMSPGKHGRVHKEKYHQQGKSFPVAVSFGHHPINFVVASTDVPNRVNDTITPAEFSAGRCKWSKVR